MHNRYADIQMLYHKRNIKINPVRLQDTNIHSGDFLKKIFEDFEVMMNMTSQFPPDILYSPRKIV